ncbi:hypothetical protein BD410DRAFT_715832, partial [Rickenella mellea]
MITPNRSDAPHFRGSPLELIEFLDEYEVIAGQARLSADDQCKRLYKYVNTNDADLWKALPERTAGIWLDYRLAIESLYPGANSTRRYTNAELRAFVAERHLLRINTVDDLGDYHREFVRRATHLTAANRLSVADKDDLYFAGFPSLPSRPQTPVDPSLCLFCMDPNNAHMMRECPTAVEYLRSGKVIKDSRDRFVLPDSSPIPRTPIGKGFQQSIDAYYAGKTRDAPPHMTDSVPIVGASTTRARAREIEKGKGKAPASEPAPRTKEATPSASTSSPVVYPPVQSTTKRPTPSSASKPVPQFKFHSAAEDQSLIDDTMKMILQGRLAELVTPAHLFAASPSLRARFVELLRTKRVESTDAAKVHAAMTAADALAATTLDDSQSATPSHYLTDDEPSIQNIAAASVPLREIECIVGEKCVEMGLIDSGAQIILIRQDLWHDLGLPLSVTNSLVMEGIASGRARTMGSIDNLRIRIGSVIFYAQAQVVESSPTRLLLGQPFFDITRAVLKPSDDGLVTITLHDPS